MKAELFQLAGPSQTHQARTESRQVCEPPRSPSITDSFPDLPSEGPSGSPETCSQELQQGAPTLCPASTGTPSAQDGQGGERETCHLQKARLKWQWQQLAQLSISVLSPSHISPS